MLWFSVSEIGEIMVAGDNVYSRRLSSSSTAPAGSATAVTARRALLRTELCLPVLGRSESWRETRLLLPTRAVSQLPLLRSLECSEGG